MEEEEEERYRPGLLDLNLQISIVKNFHHLKYQLQLTEKLAEEFKDFNTTKCAILNFRGAVQFFLKEYEDACETFRQVLGIDEDNLNALTNLENIYRHLGYWSKADEYKKRLKLDDHKLKTVCYGEQGFAMMFDCHISSNEYERYKRSKKLFQHCLKEAGLKQKANEDDVQWHLWYGQLLHRLLNSCPRNPWKVEKFDIWVEGIKQCLIVKQALRNSGDRSEDQKENHLKSVATAYIAIYAYKTDKDFKDKIIEKYSESEKMDASLEKADDAKSLESHSSVTEEVEKQLARLEDEIKSLPDEKKAIGELVSIIKDPDKGFKEALKLHQNSEVLLRYALYVKGKPNATLKDLEEAEELLDKCIQFENGGSWFAFSIKSGILLSKFKRVHEKLSSQSEQEIESSDTKLALADNSSEKFEGEHENEAERVESHTKKTADDLENWLQESVKFGKKAGKINATSQIYSGLGEAYHCLAVSQKNSDKKEEYFITALANFLHALQHAEGYKQPFVHICHGDCLFDKEQYRPALESFKRAIECGTKKLEETYVKLFKCFCIQFEAEKEMKELLVSELAYWITIGNEKFKKDGWLDGILEKLKANVKEDSQKVAQIEEAFANAARELKDRNSLKVSEKYLEENASFALCLFGETLQLQKKDYTESCIKMLSDANTKHLKEDQMMICVQNVAKAIMTYRKIYFKSPAKDHFREEAFLLSSFKQLHNQCKEFAESVAEEIKTSNPILHFLLYQKEELPTHLNVPESPVVDMTLRELIFCQKHLNFDKDQQRFKDCLEALEKYIEKFSEQESEPNSGQGVLSEPKVRKQQYEYDFLIIYTQDDSQWVVHSLLPTLEKKYGFRGYIENRDMLPGHNKYSILDIFDKCYKVIVILTDSFCRNRWCYFVFQQALYRKLGEHSVIPILRSEMKQMPKELTTVISLAAIQNLDWESLIKVLE